MKMTKNNDGTFSIDFTPNELFQYNGIGKIGVLAKAKDGTGDKKTPDYFFEVGKFNVDINSPKNSPSIISRNGSLTISTSGSIDLNYYLKKDDTLIYESLNVKNFSKIINGPDFSGEGYKLTESSVLKLLCEDVNNKDNIIIVNFNIILEPNVLEETPPFSLEDGMNYLNNENTLVSAVP